LYFYLAHPIDQAPEGQSPLTQAIAQIHTLARLQGHGLFRPAQAHRLPTSRWTQHETAKVDAINRNAIWESDGLIAILPPDVPTLGTPAEIEHALALNRPTLIVTTSIFMATSVQIQAWNRRGAAVLMMNDDGHIASCNLADMLSSLPNPTLTLLFTEDTIGHPELLVSGQAANLRPGRYKGDAGIDLAIQVGVDLHPGEYRLIPTGVRVAIPEGWFGWITGRSSTWANHRCDVRSAVIDSGYRGELMVGVENCNDRPVSFEAGTRLGQLVLLPAYTGNIRQVDELPDHERGLSGYGSSGQ
jgi:dUTP pyrophosphatase